ncbi:hypothetical protein [Actinomadura rupiterrae]|uniref:hypothetical protein n=1 Tax=Actinomadura rupiterrae TaxID=559627 RepID=UPI0020A601F2|nr:hypothetical protein [Actinomadura rupiterrae]MCP2338692.1 hypothetical protein [Actinomadura rupiterrae]
MAGVAGVFFGGLVLLGGWNELNKESVDCGGKKMLQGDRCVSTTNGHRTGENGYDEQRSDNHLEAALTMGGGAAVACGGLLYLGFVVYQAGKAAPLPVGPSSYGALPPFPPSPGGDAPYPPDDGRRPQ